MKPIEFVKTIAAGAALAALTLVAPVQANTTIRNDNGGLVNDYIIKANLAILRGERMQIDGWCASACTAYLGNPNTCVTRNALLAFHGPTGGTASQNRKAAETLARHLPPVLQGWYLSEAASLQGRDHITLTGDDLVNMGAARWC